MLAVFRAPRYLERIPMTLDSRPLRLLALALIFSLAATTFVDAASPTVPIDSSIIHQKLVARGVGKGIKVTEIDGTVVKGTLVSIDDESFQVTPRSSTQPTRIPNSQVSKIGRDGMSTGAKIGIGVAIGTTVVIVAIIISFASGPKIAI
jgi:hypothetical protein